MGQIFSRAKEFIEVKTSRKRKEISPIKTTPTPSSIKENNDISVDEKIDISLTYLDNVQQVTARPPLRLEPEITSPESLRQHSETPPRKKRRSDMEPIKYNILHDSATVEFILKSKVLVILRGLAGSGKSYLADAIHDKYKNCVTCSADHYFMKDGKYEFVFEELKQAHQASQQKTEESMANGVNVVIIDNTNIKLWEMKKYLGLARQYNYTSIIIEPQTPWARDPEELSKANSHGVSVEALQKKIQIWDNISPIYFGWFLNESDSSGILNLGLKWFKEALSVEQFHKDFVIITECFDDEEILEYFCAITSENQTTALHCTSKFINRGKAPGALEYMKRNELSETNGIASDLNVVGFIITPRSFGARIQLNEDQLKLWGQSDDEDLPEKYEFPSPLKKVNTTEVNNTNCSNGSKEANNLAQDISNMSVTEIQNEDIEKQPELQNTTNEESNNEEDQTNQSNISNVNENENGNDEEVDKIKELNDINSMNNINTSKIDTIDTDLETSVLDTTEELEITDERNQNLGSSNDETDLDMNTSSNENEDMNTSSNKNQDMNTSSNKNEVSESLDNSNTSDNGNKETTINSTHGNQSINNDETNCSNLSMNNTNEICDKDITNQVNQSSFDNPGCIGAAIQTMQDTITKPTIRQMKQNYGKYKYAPTFGLGSRAHLTLGTAPGIPNVITGHDMISVVEYEQKVKRSELTGEIECLPEIETYSLPGGAIMKKYDLDTWVIYPQRKAVVTTLFSCHHT